MGNTLSLRTVIISAILLIFLGIILWVLIVGPDNAFKQATGLVDYFADKTLGEIRGDDPIKKPSDSIPNDIKQAYNDFYTQLEKIHTETSVVPFVNLPEKMKGYTFKLSSSDNGLLFVLYDEGIASLYNSLKGKVPCIIEPDNFYKKFVLNQQNIQLKDTYQEAESITYIGKNKIEVVLKGSKDTETYTIDNGGLKDTKNILGNGYNQEINMFYNADETHKCFIITESGILGWSKPGINKNDLWKFYNTEIPALTLSTEDFCESITSCGDYQQLSSPELFCNEDYCNLFCEWYEITGETEAGAGGVQNKPELNIGLDGYYCGQKTIDLGGFYSDGLK